MKRIIVVIFLILSGCCTSRQVVISDDFFNDLSSENYRLYGLLSIKTPGKDLSFLKYDSYIDNLEKNRMPASEDLVKKIKSADDYYFESSKRSFTVILYYKKSCKIIVDSATTTFIDFVERPEGCRPSIKLEEYKSKINQKK